MDKENNFKSSTEHADNFLKEIAIAKDPDTKEEVLRDLLKRNDIDVSTAVAENLNLPMVLLEELSNHDFWMIREIIADKKDTPKEILIKLSKDKHNAVKRAAEKRLVEDYNK